MKSFVNIFAKIFFTVFIPGMRIDKINNIGFKAGLTSQIMEIEKHTNPAKVQEYFKSSPYTDWLDFRYNLDFISCLLNSVDSWWVI